MSEPNQTWCWYCKQEIPPESDTCPSCGKPLNDSMKVVRCRSCGKYLLKSIGVCDSCGTPQEMPAVPVAAMPEETPAEGELRRIPDNLDALEKQATGRSPMRWFIPATVAVIVLLIAVIVVLLVRGGAGGGSNEPAGPTYCAEDAHLWLPADCTHPRTCSICGKTEGEPVGHDFVQNVCTVCGAYKKPFYFFDSTSERSGTTVNFSGSIMNYAGVDVASLTIKLDLYDEEKQRLVSETAEAVTGGPLHPLDSTRWEMQYNDSGLKWKYWRISAVEFNPAEEKES